MRAFALLVAARSDRQRIEIHLSNYSELDFNLDFYTEVLYLKNALSAPTPRSAALNMAMISLIEDFSLVGFKTLAGEDKSSMLHLMHTIDRASGYIFVPQATSTTDPTIDASEATRPNASALFSSAAGLMRHDVRDVQEW
ncbi:GPN-loop GTPase 2 [Mycena sanguinolenta]|uniref:GPN-loop GTPase 2 n=1 Tax=Mycena sanguinolenta TaxID=230812 RepID=A0A8H7DBT0_9AGAR|nr:GPN-loop GTPase 2 [Mycena sanguinolenta]